MVAAHRARHATHRHLPSVGISQQGGDVVKQDARLGEIGDALDVRLEIHARLRMLTWSGDVSTARAGGKSSCFRRYEAKHPLLGWAAARWPINQSTKEPPA